VRIFFFEEIFIIYEIRMKDRIDKSLVS